MCECESACACVRVRGMGGDGEFVCIGMVSEDAFTVHNYTVTQGGPASSKRTPRQSEGGCVGALRTT
jgi:hypothetical protein